MHYVHFSFEKVNKLYQETLYYILMEKNSMLCMFSIQKKNHWRKYDYSNVYLYEIISPLYFVHLIAVRTYIKKRKTFVGNL